MKVLVTGANGFLGSNIIRVLLQRGVEVRGMIRKTADTRAIDGLPIERYYGEITEAADVRTAVRECDRIIHTAALTSQQQRNYRAFEEANVVATRNLLDACVRYATKRIVFISTANTIGFGNAQNPGHEGLPASPLFLRSYYVRSKFDAQQLVLNYVAEKQIDAIVLNPTFMIGAFDTRPGSGRIILMHQGKKHVFVPSGGKNFVHVQDVATAACNALSHGRRGQCYLTGGENLSYSEFLAVLAGITGSPSHIHVLPKGIVSAAGLAGSLLSGLGMKTDLNRINARLLRLRNYYDSSMAISELFMPQTPVKLAVQDAIEWYVQLGLLPRHPIFD